MIKASNGRVELKGTTPSLLADLAVTIKSMYRELLVGSLNMSENDARQKIYDAVRIALADNPDEVMEAMKREQLESTLDQLLSKLRELRVEDEVED